MLNARSIQGIIVFTIAMFLAVWLGMALVMDQTETLLKVAGAVVFFTAVFLGRRVWLLLILFSAMNVVLLRGFGTTDIGQMVFLAFSAALFMMRKLRIKVQFGELEFWALLIVTTIVQTYLRNPVGLNLMGAGNVGGRPYIVMAISISASAVLSVLLVEAKEIRWAMYLTMIGSFLGIPGTILRYGDLGSGNDDLSRVPVLGTLSNIMGRILVSRISPLRACLHPLWGLVLLLSLVAAGASGYRNSVAMLGLIYFFGICYRGGTLAVMSSVLAGAFALVLLALINLNFPLPGNIQRALSPFPGTWEEKYKNQAELSTEWRVEMWKEALTSERWIQNKILGDGVGMTAAQLEQNERIGESQVGTSRSGLLVQQENMLINGSYHSGPVHSIRAVGYVGLGVLLLAMIRLAVYAHRQIIRCKGTEWFPVALFFCVPLLVQPFFFVFIFGEFHTGVASTMMGIAIVRLLEKNLPLPAWKKAVYQPYILRKQAGQLQDKRLPA